VLRIRIRNNLAFLHLDPDAYAKITVP
jgi:hypothetical protein